jgi:hypothetical protein
VLSKCANPSCSTSFLYLRDGRLFEADVDTGEVRPVLELSAEFDAKIARHAGTSEVELRPDTKKELFWLCGSCCRTRTIMFAKNGGLALVPLHAADRLAAA